MNTQNASAPCFAKTVLHQSPFAVLGATAHDDRRRIVELAEEKSLELDSGVCQKARADLTNPRTRLGAEIAWLPGVAPLKAWQLLGSLLQNPLGMRAESQLPKLAHLNLLAAAFESIDGQQKAGDLSKFIQEVASLAENLSSEDVLQDINADRAVSDFQTVKAVEQVEEELTERKRYYRNAIKEALNKLPTATLIQVMTDTVDGVTAGGKNSAPGLIDDLVDSYEVETQEFLEKEAENIDKLIKSIRDAAGSGETAVKPYIDKLDAVARNWDKVAQPIQLSAKARGIGHKASQDVAYKIRNLAVDLFNKNGMLAQSQRLTNLIQNIFSEVPDVVEQVEEDAVALANIFNQRKQAETRKNEWEREITYHAEIGLVFKDSLGISPDGVSWFLNHCQTAITDSLGISPDGVSWKGQRFPLNSITRVRWGAVRHFTNGILMRTDYTIAFGDSRSEAVVQLRKESIYETFLDKLWKAVCVRLLIDMLQTMKSGRDMRFNDAVVHDDSVTLVKHNFFGFNKDVRCSWEQVLIWSADGSFFIGLQGDEKIYSSISYINDANTHILEQAIRMAFKKPGMRRLSDLLNDLPR